MRKSTAAAGAAALLLAPTTAQAQAWGQPAQPPPAQEQPLDAGGLTPPGSQPEQPYQAPGPTEQELARADREDSGRGLELLFILGEVGLQYLGLETLHGNDLVDSTVDSAPFGPVYGGAVGLRFVFVTAGADFRYSPFPDFGLWTINGQLGVRAQKGALDLYATLGGGYVSAALREAGPAAGGRDVDITGWDLRLLGGLDWYLSPAFSLGAALGSDLLFLRRAAVSGASGVYAADGSSIGSSVTLCAVAGLHF
jgi:hypothetical protein